MIVRSRCTSATVLDTTNTRDLRLYIHIILNHDFSTTRMLFNSLSIILLALFSTSTARPSNKLHRRGLPGAVYTCTSTDFRGNCQWTAPPTRCIQPGPASLGAGIQSLGPDPGGFCTLYEKFDCTGSEVQTVRFPGISSGLPQFGAFRCFADGAQGNATVDAATLLKGPTKVLDPLADPRLAGGVGSMERKKHLKELKEMEKDGFKDGLIGFKKDVYY
ncbi:hypothetical protein BKA66DRAFT_449535 [Pyrenochaeta sp. MPI-SDFR-AT-0127]|nr:hypothetical protein BKA66DRAFT_449535 [Pyrenochaeta sp. MPI-SDFR-AT-0127]